MERSFGLGAHLAEYPGKIEDSAHGVLCILMVYEDYQSRYGTLVLFRGLNSRGFCGQCFALGRIVEHAWSRIPRREYVSELHPPDIHDVSLKLRDIPENGYGSTRRRVETETPLRTYVLDSRAMSMVSRFH